MLIETDNLIKQFFEEQKDSLLKGISYEETITICKAPFQFIRKQMSRIELPDIHIKYFGTFRVTIPKLKKQLQKLEERYMFLRIDKEEYETTKTKYLTKIAELERDEEITTKINSNSTLEIVNDYDEDDISERDTDGAEAVD